MAWKWGKYLPTLFIRISLGNYRIFLLRSPFFFYFFLFTHQILRQILERPKTDYVQLEIKLERKKSRGDEWLYFWICRKKENQMEISSGAQRILYTTVCAVGYCTTSFLFFDFVLEKKKKTNILIPIEFLMEQFPVRSAAATKALK